MHSEMPSWQKAAQAKRQAILNAIPQKWRIQYDTLPVDVTGEFIQGYLTPREIEITESDAIAITSQTTSGSWSAVEVTEAFCHRAAIAHQLVCYPAVDFIALRYIASVDSSIGQLST